jgi:hypothetical protein
MRGAWDSQMCADIVHRGQYYPETCQLEAKPVFRFPDWGVTGVLLEGVQ